MIAKSNSEVNSQFRYNSFVQKTVILNKKMGETPLETIEKFRLAHDEYNNVKLCYAGRLDPMAEGLLLILVGDECKNRKTYEQFPKTYEFEILLGISTDTYDIMGLPNPGLTSLYLNNSRTNPGQTSFELKKICTSFVGKRNQPYPPYSSPRVNGKPLFYWAREGKLKDVKIPTKQIEIYSLEYLNSIEITVEKFAEIAIGRISRVKGQFRQKEIITQWLEFEQINKGKTLTGAKFKISCSSGTYVRSVAHEIGRKLKTGAITFSIKRTKIGDYSLPSHSA